jgi:hypothetical protein
MLSMCGLESLRSQRKPFLYLKLFFIQMRTRPIFSAAHLTDAK